MRIDFKWLLFLLSSRIYRWGLCQQWVYHHFIWLRWLKTYWKAPWDGRWMRRDWKKAREIKKEQAASKQRLSTLNKTFVCDWGFPIRATWPLLWRSLRTQIPSLSCFLSPDLGQHTTYPYCMRTNFSDNLSDRFVQGLDVFSRRGLSEWHKLPLIKILTIQAKWSFSVNTAEGESKWHLWWAFGEWGLGFSFSFPVVLSWGKPVLKLEMCLSDQASTLSKKLTAVYRMLLWQRHQLFIYSARPLIRKMSNGAFTLGFLVLTQVHLFAEFGSFG